MIENKDDIIVFNTEDATKEVIREQIFPLVAETDPILKEVMPEFDFKDPPTNAIELASGLVDTCKRNRGIGLSANQCGLRYRVFVMGYGEEYVAYFNPKVINTRGEVHMIEGCLSFPLLGLRITRPESIDVEYQDYNGEKRTATFTGISARCFLHELDHMNGILYTKKVKPLALKRGIEKRNKTIKKFVKITK